jgi:antitoxin component HigA of HigAB toxin-antitoxin module
MVAFLLEQRGLAPKDLWPVVGSKSRVSEILGGKRPMTTERMRQGNYRVDKGGGLAYRRAAAQAVGVSPASR